MTTPSDLERRLADVLQQHAEDAMNDTKTEERLDTLLSATQRDTRRRRRVWAAGALAAAAAAAAVIAWAPGLGGDEEGATGPGVAATGSAAQAERVATRFVSAYAAFDRPGVDAYLDRSVIGFEGWRRENRWFEAVGLRMLLDPCRAQGPSALGGTRVLCPYDYDSMHSDALGRGPFTGSEFAVNVREGQVIAADLGLLFEVNGFSAQVWEPFAAWVTEQHPDDAAIMYADWPATTDPAQNVRSDRLWRQRTLEYLKEQQAANLAPG